MNQVEFEDVVMDALECWVNEGLPLMRTQSWASKREGYRLSQGVNVIVDSPVQEYYCALELKTRDVTTENGPGLYFSTDYEPKKIEKQLRFAKQSQRRIAVAVEMQNYKDEFPCYLVPLELFLEIDEFGKKKVTWNQIAFFGSYLGDSVEGTVSIDAKKFDMVEEVAEWVKSDIEQALDEAEQFSGESDKWWKSTAPCSWNLPHLE